MKKLGFWDRSRGAMRLAGLGVILAWSAIRYLALGARRRELAVKAEWLSLTCRHLLAGLGVRLVSDGGRARGAVIVANHVSYLDIMVISALTPVVFVAKREVRGWPVFGWFAAKAGTRFIDREKRGDVSRIGDELAPIMAAGASVVLFLEGTTSDGREVLPFRSSLLAPAVKEAWLLAPAGITYAVPEGRSVEQEVCWWGEMTLLPHLKNIATLSWIEARVGWGDARKAGGDRKLLAEELRVEIVRLRARKACGLGG
jgi:1-acyl-sn-glycerol-3-phosphate acyltransferase